LLCVGFDPYEGGTNFYQHIDNSQLFNMAWYLEDHSK
jgi:hypothetical protein